MGSSGRWLESCISSNEGDSGLGDDDRTLAHGLSAGKTAKDLGCFVLSQGLYDEPCALPREMKKSSSLGASGLRGSLRLL